MTKKQALHLLHQMLLIRRFEEKSAELYTKEKIRGFLHLYIGEEAVAVGVMEALKPNDAVVATYREHGHALARGLSARSIMAEMYGKQEGCSRGRGGSMHLFDVDKRFYGGNAIVGGGLPVAAGLALAIKMKGTADMVCCFFGEGAIAEGEFHETMNLAALWHLPILFLCENNLYAMGTALSLSESETNLIKKTTSYGIESLSVNGMDLQEVIKTSKSAVELIRRKSEPVFLECKTYRFKAHSMFDAELYREKSEVRKWKQHDPIDDYIKLLKSNKKTINDRDVETLEKRIASTIDEAVTFAENGTLEPVEDLTRFVYSEDQQDHG